MWYEQRKLAESSILQRPNTHSLHKAYSDKKLFGIQRSWILERRLSAACTCITHQTDKEHGCNGSLASQFTVTVLYSHCKYGLYKLGNKVLFKGSKTVCIINIQNNYQVPVDLVGCIARLMIR